MQLLWVLLWNPRYSANSRVRVCVRSRMLSSFQREYSFGDRIRVVYGTILVVRQILNPKLLLIIWDPPLATLIAIYIGYKVMGILGLVVGPILLVVIKAASRANLFSRWI